MKYLKKYYNENYNITHLKLLLGSFTTLDFHMIYIWNYSELEDGILTSTLTYFLNMKIAWFKFYQKNCLAKKSNINCSKWCKARSQNLTSTRYIFRNSEHKYGILIKCPKYKFSICSHLQWIQCKRQVMMVLRLFLHGEWVCARIRQNVSLQWKIWPPSIKIKLIMYVY